MLIPVTRPEALSEQSLVFRKALSELLHAQKSQGFRFGLFAPPVEPKPCKDGPGSAGRGRLLRIRSDGRATGLFTSTSCGGMLVGALWIPVQKLHGLAGRP
jgi:hypothetical protein